MARARAAAPEIVREPAPLGREQASGQSHSHFLRPDVDTQVLARAPSEPPESRPDLPRGPRGDPGGGAPREERTLPLFAALPAPGHAKTRLPREPGGQLCRYLRHLRLRGQANRRSRSSGRQIRPDSRGNGTRVSAISGAKPRVFDGFRGEEAIWPEKLVETHRGARVFRPELAAPERN